MWGGDPTRSNVTKDGPSANGLHLAWTSPAIDGSVYGEPLVVGSTVIVATDHDSVYAFDSATGAAKWQQVGLGRPVAASSLPCGDVDPVGITSTPVADPANNRVYVVGMLQPNHHELIALDLRDGSILFRKTVDAPGADPTVHNQRGALAFANGKVYIPFGGRFGDCGQYRGRIVAVAADGSGDPITYTVRANREGGFWTPPGPAVAPDGTLLVASGNSDTTTDFDDGNAVIRLSPDLHVLDEFAPTNFAQLNGGDVDLGTTSPALLDGNRVFQVGKSGVGYLLAADHLGGVGGEVHQQQVCDRVMGAVAHDGATIFAPCPSSVVVVSVTDAGFTQNWSTPIAQPGPPMVANGIVWVIDVRGGVVHALDGQSGTEVFHAPVGDVTHFSAPSEGNGFVFVAGGGNVKAFTSAGNGTPLP